MISELLQLQFKHTRYVARLIEFANSRGFECSWGEALRTPAQANSNAVTGTGISNSLHIQRLAVDLLLFKDGQYLTDSESYRELGTFWKSLDPLCCWGGDFKDKDGKPKPDGNHFSITYRGVK